MARQSAARVARVLAVPMSAPAITAFRHHIIDRWLRAIRRRGQKHRLPWSRMKQIANRYLPYPRILHPWPEQRFLVTHPIPRPPAPASGSIESCAKMVVVEQPSEGAPSMGKSITDLSSVTTVGLDLAKHVFQVHGIDASVIVTRGSGARTCW